MVIYGKICNREDKDTVRITVVIRLEKKTRPKKGQRMKFGCKREVKVLLEDFRAIKVSTQKFIIFWEHLDR